MSNVPRSHFDDPDGHVMEEDPSDIEQFQFDSNGYTDNQQTHEPDLDLGPRVIRRRIMFTQPADIAIGYLQEPTLNINESASSRSHAVHSTRAEAWHSVRRKWRTHLDQFIIEDSQDDQKDWLLTKAIDIRNVHGSHTLIGVRNIAACVKCGYWMQQTSKGLRTPCTATISVGRRSTLRRLQKGWYPYKRPWPDGVPGNQHRRVRRLP